MNAHTIGMLLVSGAGLAGLVWVLHKIGKVLISMFEALATIAVVFLALWAAVKTLVWLARQSWRTGGPASRPLRSQCGGSAGAGPR